MQSIGDRLALAEREILLLRGHLLDMIRESAFDFRGHTISPDFPKTRSEAVEFMTSPNRIIPKEEGL